MTRREFEKLRDLPGKKLVGDIVYTYAEATSPVATFDSMKIENSLDIPLRLSGKYNGLVPTIVFNFRIMGVGPICRVEVNSTMHKGSRTHKHALTTEDDPRQNLPNVVNRPDLAGKSARQVWMMLCEQANIEHVGQFIDP
jgi:hypothetical protein